LASIDQFEATMLEHS